MKRSPAMRIRMDLAMKTDPADLQSLTKTAQAIEALKARATELGFVFTKPVTTTMGSYAFTDDNPPEEPDSQY